MERWFEDAFRSPVPWSRSWPRLDITLTDDTVTISGEKTKEEKVEKKNYYRVERSSGAFARSFRPPRGLQISRSKATFKDGMLQLTLPKTDEAKKRTRKVRVR